MAIGLAAVSLSPMYIAEVAPAPIRGRLVAINQLTVVIGILLAQYINWYLVRSLPAGASDDFIRNSWFGQQGWRWMFGLTGSRAGDAVLFWDVSGAGRVRAGWKRTVVATRRAVFWKKVGGPEYAAAASAEIRSTLTAEEIQKVRFADLLDPKMGRVLVLGIVLAVFQQWCGING